MHHTDVYAVLEVTSAPNVVLMGWPNPELVHELGASRAGIRLAVLPSSRLDALTTEAGSLAMLRSYLAINGLRIGLLDAEDAAILGQHLGRPERIIALPPIHPPAQQVFQRSKSAALSIFVASRQNVYAQCLAAVRYATINDSNLILSTNVSPTNSLVELFDGERFVLNTKTESLEYDILMAASDLHDLEAENSVADAVMCMTPIVVSGKIDWVNSWAKTKTCDVSNLIVALVRVHDKRTRRALAVLNRRGLGHYNNQAWAAWREWLRA